MTEHDLYAIILDKLGLPGAVVAALVWAVWRFGPPHKATEPDSSAKALSGVEHEISEMRAQLTRIETILIIDRAAK